MASLTQWTQVWANSRRRWRTGKPGLLQSMGWQRVGPWLSNWNKCLGESDDRQKHSTQRLPMLFQEGWMSARVATEPMRRKGPGQDTAHSGHFLSVLFSRFWHDLVKDPSCHWYCMLFHVPIKANRKEKIGESYCINTTLFHAFKPN